MSSRSSTHPFVVLAVALVVVAVAAYVAYSSWRNTEIQHAKEGRDMETLAALGT